MRTQQSGSGCARCGVADGVTDEVAKSKGCTPVTSVSKMDPVGADARSLARQDPCGRDGVGFECCPEASNIR